MSYQTNFRVFIPDCEFWETEILSKLRDDVMQAVSNVVERNLGKRKEVAVTSPEVVYLNK